MKNVRTKTVAMAALLFSAPVFADFPGFDNPSPTAGSSTSEKANATADKGMYKQIDYVNAGKKGPKIIVLPGEIKSNNAGFLQKFGSNNIADYAELELSNANFGVLERSDLGPVLKEVELAYALGDPDKSRALFRKGKLKNTKWLVKFDILKAENIAEAGSSFSGGALGSIAGTLMGGRSGAVTSTAGRSIEVEESTGVWIIGMRYKIVNAETSEQVATGYFEEKQELGAKKSGFLGFGSSEKGGLSLDGMVQRLVQRTVYDIDEKHK